ncbi:MAG TPA: hypothetical protein DIC49_00970 [Gammaproteobacteria bacterium]|nr:hypothetical protein [Gammaproteobacteria bacterium]
MRKSFAHMKRIWPYAWANGLSNGVNMTETELYRQRKQLFYNWLRVSLISLIALRISGLWLLTPPATVMGAIGVTLILVAFVWPILKADIKASLWLSFISCLFFTIGVLNAMTEGREVFGIVESVLAAGIFFSAMLFARNGYRELEAKTEALEQSTT